MSFLRPQRVSRPEPIGSLLKRITVAAPRRGFAEPEGGDLRYLASIRQLPCLKCGVDPCGAAAHLRLNSALHNKRQAMAKKPSSRWVTPLCAGCHTNDPDAQHRIGEELFWTRIGINPFLACERLFAAREDFVRLRATAYSIIAERSNAPR
jgi:hypothetical protein